MTGRQRIPLTGQPCRRPERKCSLFSRRPRADLALWSILLLFSAPAQGQAPEEGLHYFQAVSLRVDKLKQQAASKNNGWRWIAPLLANKGEPTEPNYEMLKERGEALYRGWESHQLEDAAELGKFVGDFQPYFNRIRQAAHSPILLYPYNWDKIPNSQITYGLVQSLQGSGKKLSSVGAGTQGGDG